MKKYAKYGNILPKNFSPPSHRHLKTLSSLPYMPLVATMPAMRWWGFGMLRIRITSARKDYQLFVQSFPYFITFQKFLKLPLLRLDASLFSYFCKRNDSGGRKLYHSMHNWLKIYHHRKWAESWHGIWAERERKTKLLCWYFSCRIQMISMSRLEIVFCLE